MKKIRDIISKPSEALRAMVDGLLEQSQREDFRIDMSDWGSTDGTMCFGCAATCTLQRLAGVNLVPKRGVGSYVPNFDWRIESYGFNEIEVNDFENIMDSVRMGELSHLFEYFYVDFSNIEDSYCWSLGTSDWKEQLPEVEKTIEYLIAQGV